jgi:dehydrogenase/reductase SDR family protein 7B
MMENINNTTKTILLLLLLPLSVAAFAFTKPSGGVNVGTDCSEETKISLNGKNVILTGASSGLGKALAFQIAKCGVNTLVLSGRNVEQLNHVKSNCEEIHANANKESTSTSKSTFEIVPCDLSDESSVTQFSSKAMSICDEKADMLILCGGISSRSSFLETTPEVDKMLMQVNFLSGSAIAKRVIPSMVDKSSSTSSSTSSTSSNIIWISSIQGLLGTPYRTSYAASKFAVQGYCEALRAELSSQGVQVSCVSPGYIQTNLSKGAIRGDGSKHGQMDESTAKGADPNELAVEILDSVKGGGKTDLVVAATLSAKVALFLKFFAPSLLEQILVKRFQKESSKQKS